MNIFNGVQQGGKSSMRPKRCPLGTAWRVVLSHEHILAVVEHPLMFRLPSFSLFHDTNMHTTPLLKQIQNISIVNKNIIRIYLIKMNIS